MTINLACFRCSKINTIPDGKVHRSDTCNHCGEDLRVCKNCSHYSPSLYNECKETQAERVTEKEKRNFCEYFVIRNTTNQIDQKTMAMKALDDLFKK